MSFPVDRRLARVCAVVLTALSGAAYAQSDAPPPETEPLDLSKLDPRNINGGVFLRLNGPVIKSHGGTDEVGFKGALGLGYEIARNKVMDKIAEGMRRFPTLNAAPAEVAVQEIEAKPA